MSKGNKDLGSTVSYYDVTGMEVASWSPGAAGEDVPPTQVHLLIPVGDTGVTLVVRLKSRAACDSLIAALIDHRDDVFGKKDAP